MSKKRAKKIKLILFDVDGTLTDGKFFFIPVPAAMQQSMRDQAAKHGGYDFSAATSTAVEVKGFNAHDGAAFSLARLGGIKTGIITKRSSETVAVRARDLKMDHVHQGIQDKLSCLEQILKQEGLKRVDVAFVGDDVIDLPVMRICGLAIAVASARAEVKKEAHYVTPNSGGNGAARDAIEYVLKAQGKWKKVVDEYIYDRSPKKKERN